MTIAGNPQPGATAVDITELRPGPFNSEPTSFQLDTGYGAPERVRLIEARRLLNYLILPTYVDPDAHKQESTGVFASHLGLPVSEGILDAHKQVIKDNVKFIAGVASIRSNGSARRPKEVSVAVLQFESDSESSWAAKELNNISMTVGARNSLDIPGHPNAHSSSSEGNAQIDTWQPHGPYVVFISTKQPPGESNTAISRVKNSLEEQNRALDTQRPIPLDDVLDQPLDPDNIVRRTMDRESRDAIPSTDDFGTYLPAGILHYQNNSVDARKEFETAGVDLVGRRASTVYRTRDAAAAFGLQAFLTRRGRDDTPLTPPFGIADAQCVRFDTFDDRENNAICVVVHGRYVAVVSAKSTGYSQIDIGLQERTAAQFIILEKCE
ncbi:hypothetical protein [Nocardia sp. A7]|uniref:DUF7373 family lipoprotein n=1 Tax=Nocardia sp. A7 TaxID=2789274 RepID=UPI00397E2110